MGLSDDKNQNLIVRGGNLDFTPEPNGLGWNFFKVMTQNKLLVAQRDGTNGLRDTYGHLLERCVNTALEMRSRGIKQGDVISLCSFNHLNSCVPFIATQFLGAKMASFDPTLSVSETAYLIKLVSPKMIFVGHDSVGLIEEALSIAGNACKVVVFGSSDIYGEFGDFIVPKEESSSFTSVKVDNDETAIIHFSSGTTGMPKGICIPHRAFLLQAYNLIHNMGFNFSTSFAYATLYWISNSATLVACIMVGGSRLLVSKFDIDAFWKLVSRFQVSQLFLGTSQALSIYKVGRPEGINTSQLNNVLIGGGPISGDNLVKVRSIFPDTHVVNVFGQTETGGLTFAFDTSKREDVLAMHKKPGSCGKPVRGIDYKIVDHETEKLLGPNQKGELRMKTKIQLNEYFQQDSSGCWDQDGWFKTGDMAYYDEEQCFYVVDRLKELIKYHSFHVAPAVIEGVLLTHPAVAMAIVVGVPHEIDGDHPAAVVVLKNTESVVEAEEFVKYVETRLDDRHRLRGGVMIWSSLPATATGKLKRKDIRDMVLEARS